MNPISTTGTASPGIAPAQQSRTQKVTSTLRILLMGSQTKQPNPIVRPDIPAPCMRPTPHTIPHNARTRQPPSYLESISKDISPPPSYDEVMTPPSYKDIVKNTPFNGFNKRVIISSDSDFTVRNGARVHATHRKVKDENCYSLSTNGEKSYGILIGTKIKPLEGLTLRDKLDIHGHGNTDNFENKSAKQLAELLSESGLKNVGVLKIQACSVGKKDFLSDLMTILE